jgi:hypothetical protein
MAALARAGIHAGVALRLDGERILFEHTAGLTAATKR